MLLRFLPSLLALFALLALEASAWPTPNHLHVKPASKEELHDGSQQTDYVSAGSGPLETYSDKVLVEEQGDDRTASQSSCDSQPWHNVDAVEGPGEGYL
ncbi:hypothetical protein IW261DRAFT_729635 [Armillaria novae-zelandiae]|uniref:Uncharacterized protein n=1 Tax=Armillaria novae-zelandiae TaxID=153914 RepID=A0AA39U7Z0_9AGAR|nr:hypothetical protein IW261DRAFT_729635 [Armillaria novae-zelandiae]